MKKLDQSTDRFVSENDSKNKGLPKLRRKECGSLKVFKNVPGLKICYRLVHFSRNLNKKTPERWLRYLSIIAIKDYSDQFNSKLIIITKERINNIKNERVALTSESEDEGSCARCIPVRQRRHRIISVQRSTQRIDHGPIGALDPSYHHLLSDAKSLVRN